MCPSDLAPLFAPLPAHLAGAVRLIVCDLDGTLLDREKRISPATRAAIDAVRERGITVTICTGRIPEMMEAYSRYLGLTGLFIATNGAAIVDAQSGEMPFRQCAGGTETRRLLEYCARRGLDHVAATSEGCYYSAGSRRIKRFEQYNEIAQQDGLKLIPLCPFGSDYSRIETMEIAKVLISGLSPQAQRETETYLKSLPRLAFTASDPQMLDIGPAGVDKGTGVRKLAGIMGLTKAQICVFGDYDNDIPMFEAAGFSVAMGNAEAAVKNRATALTASNDEDGVALAIKKYFV